MKLALSKIRSYMKALAVMAAMMLPASAVAQNVKAELDSNVIELASQARLTITANARIGAKVMPPTFKDNKIVPTLEVVSTPKTDTIAGSKQDVTYKFHYMITSFEDSTYTIPSIAVLIDKDSMFTEPLKITFTLLQGIDSTFTSEIDTTKLVRIFDIKDVKDTPWTFAEFWARYGNIILVILLVALIASAVTYVIIRHRRNKPIIPFSKPKEPAENVAFRRLNELKEKNLCEQGKVKEYYSELTEIIKIYLSERYGESVMESTSAETLATISKYVGRNSDPFNNLASIFDLADFAKFAKLQPLPDENARCMNYAFEIVEATRPIPQPDPNAAPVAEQPNIKTN
ncbi:MAG: hypothetical protein J6T96_09495 [Bacteroidales bacterium]|nr:hypothetical protein [Bacteroidales bacterium]MBO7567625.1 hypothetical protein [Bacteroidales bacterium]MBP5682395.1 hypothetical protein [Bacteroidales bacterium]